MLEGIGLLGVCIMMALLMRWMRAYDGAPDGKSDGLFAFRETKRGQMPKKNE